MPIPATAVLNFALRDLRDPKLRPLGWVGGSMRNCKDILNLTILFAELKCYYANFELGLALGVVPSYLL
jgi:hypothetical protein